MHASEGLLAKARRAQRELGLNRKPAALIDQLEARELLSTTYSITVRDNTNGKPLAGASVSVVTANMCYAPLTTNSQGTVTITTTAPIRTVVTTRSGYLPNYATVSNGTPLLFPTLQPTPSTLFKARMQAASRDLFYAAASPRLLGQTTLSGILNHASVVTGAAGVYCAIGSSSVVAAPVTGPCAVISGAGFATASFLSALYSEGIYEGILPETKLNVWYLPSSNGILILPAA